MPQKMPILMRRPVGRRTVGIMPRRSTTSATEIF